MQIEEVFDWVAQKGGEHVELATFTIGPGMQDMMSYRLADDPEVLNRLTTASANSGVLLSGLCISASFLGSAEERQAQIDRAKSYVELCAHLGVGFLRFDVVPWPLRLENYAQFEREFPSIVAVCREIAEHGETHGVMTSIEDHGFFMNGSERVRRLIHAVDHPFFRMTLDVGNFLCVDEDALIGTQACLPHAAFVHLKDFHIRKHAPGEGWLETYHGRHILGSIFGHGDMDTHKVIELMLRSGYDGFVSLEFEGLESSLVGCEMGLANIRRMVDEVSEEIARG
ncbi:sugar phosphate isomerase/epimerase family protein [Pelagovum pacificum]|nr:sugar phosphate isomerase/epimerase family protein [Pelagovum pacificum]QQA43172.1 sugar phosphate isomerase/epimerase [Pelagovum pacificum]